MLKDRQPIRSSLLARETLPDVKDAFAIIPRKESHRGIASSFSGSVTKPQISSFVAKSNSWNYNGKKIDNNKRIGNSTNNRGPNPNLHCINCGKVGHTVDRCFDIIGYPPGYNKNSGPKSNGPRIFFNANYVSSSSEKGNQSSVCYVSKSVWHTRLDHPSDQAVDMLHQDLNFTKDFRVKAVGSKWLWKIKYKSTGEIERYKARVVAKGFNQRKGFDYLETFSPVVKMSTVRLGHPSDQAVDMLHQDLNFTKDSHARVVAKGFNQRKGFDYLETFSPVVKMSTVRCMLNVAICNNWDLFQLDINNAFLYGDLTGNVYMTLPLGFDNDKSMVCKLNKSMYGLKSSAEAEYRRMAFSTCEAIYLSKLLSDMGVTCLLPIVMYCDNRFALQIATNLVFHEKYKHLEIDVHLVRKKVTSGVIKTEKIHSSQQTADILTKGLGFDQHKELCKKLGMLDMFSLDKT
nr:retrovirus-related Pol polyprotein from transposon TNT 1-94 [Tanacetum cinerariifolium]